MFPPPSGQWSPGRFSVSDCTASQAHTGLRTPVTGMGVPLTRCDLGSVSAHLASGRLHVSPRGRDGSNVHREASSQHSPRLARAFLWSLGHRGLET